MIILPKLDEWLIQSQAKQFKAGPRKSQQEFEAEVNRQLGDDYQVIGTYRGILYPITMLHKLCGRQYVTNGMNPLRGNGCPYCKREKHKRLMRARGYQKALAFLGDDYQLMSEYQGWYGKVLIKSLKCGHQFWIEYGYFHAHKRCPVCSGHYGHRQHINCTGFGQWLKEQCNKKHMSIVKLSVLSGLQPGRISKIEHGVIEPTKEDKDRLQYYLK